MRARPVARGVIEGLHGGDDTPCSALRAETSTRNRVDRGSAYLYWLISYLIRDVPGFGKCWCSALFHVDAVLQDDSVSLSSDKAGIASCPLSKDLQMAETKYSRLQRFVQKEH